ncbi:MAG TPA: tetratricopeptide repeat protein [Casimicrobiaceae bacterium]|nr:tetratricopeptide repeat protein [Casimicrobiaceae bacterium]
MLTSVALAALLSDRDPSAIPLALSDTEANDPGASALRGEMLRRAGDAAAARPLLEAAVVAFPDVLMLHHLAALACAASGDPGTACAHWEALLARAPDTAGAWFNLGQARNALGAGEAALNAWAHASRLTPNDARAVLRAGLLHGERAELPEAIDKLTRAIAIAPGNAHAWFARAAHRSSLALHRDAIADLREAVRLRPDDAAGHSALLVELHYDRVTLAGDALKAEHVAWSKHASTRRIELRDGSRRPRLRIAYLSPRFGDAPLASLFLPVLEAHDRARFELVCYAAHPVSGLTAERICNAVDLWRHLPADDEKAAALIASDDCDLLIDLAGHSPGNRLPLLARKPARVIACWLDWFDTTGVDAIDYLIGDAVHTPIAHADRFTERLALTPRCRFVYRAPVLIHESPSPAARKGYVTFASFNRHAKITDEVADLWRDILRAIPNARLSLRASAYRSRSSVQWIRERWTARGMPIERVDFAPFVGLDALHSAYDDVDVALDPFPFNGGVTTCDALAHGVPVVTLEGDAMVARQGAALLTACGRDEWIAKTPADYASIAIKLATTAAPDERRRIQQSFARSPLTNVATFTRELEALFETMIVTGPGAGSPLVAGARE